jgi:hypothetical protein
VCARAFGGPVGGVRPVWLSGRRRPPGVAAWGGCAVWLSGRRSRASRAGRAVVSDAGALLFARYAYPPNELGYCGPGGGPLVAAPPSEIARRARRFEGAWAYLEFLASVAGVDDPLDPGVVSAYWVGGPLLAEASPGALLDFLRERFAGQIGGTWREAGSRAVAHHSFQVFEVYPWAGLLQRTGNPAALDVLDRCRIRVGTVRDVFETTATVSCRPLVTFGDGRIEPGPPRDETVAWAAAGVSLLDRLVPGDRVALHWDWICEVLDDDQAALIESQERRRLSFE